MAYPGTTVININIDDQGTRAAEFNFYLPIYLCNLGEIKGFCLHIAILGRHLTFL